VAQSTTVTRVWLKARQLPACGSKHDSYTGVAQSTTVRRVWLKARQLHVCGSK